MRNVAAPGVEVVPGCMLVPDEGGTRRGAHARDMRENGLLPGRYYRIRPPGSAVVPPGAGMR